MAVCMLAACCIAPFPASADEPAQTLYGDTNTDGSVDVADAVLNARFYAEDREAVITDQGRINGDVNGDGNIDSEDITQILEYISRKRSVLGPEKPAEKLTKTVDMTEGLERSVLSGKGLDDAFLNAQFELTANLLKEVCNNSEPDQNVLISPLSLGLALGMAANGAKEETRTEMEQLLGGDMDIETMNAYYLTYVNRLLASAQAKVSVANSVWIKDDESRIIVPEEFLQTAKDYYDAGVFRAPFDDGTVDDLNSWVCQKTDGMIPQLIEEFEPLEIMVIINALSFDGKWGTPFKSYQVSNEKFFVNEGLNFDDEEFYFGQFDPADYTEAEFMGSTENFYVMDEKAVGVVKPYRGDYSFVGVIPNAGVTVDEYIGSMDGSSLKKLMDSKTEKTGLVYSSIPKFKYSCTNNMNDTLKALGMKQAFDRNTADFTGLNKRGETWLGKVLHKTEIEVNEIGTRAAAVTSAHFNGGGGIRKDAVFVDLDHPFIFMIVDNSTNLPVFIGRVMRPEY